MTQKAGHMVLTSGNVDLRQMHDNNKRFNS